MDSLPDKDLLIAADENRAFKALFERYWELLYRHALLRIGNDADAQDLVQDVFISAWKNRRKIQVSGSLSPYLFTALKYAVIKRIYREAKKGVILPLNVDLLDEAEPYGSDLLQFKELSSFVEQQTRRLPARMQDIYRLSREEQMPVAEIAHYFNISEQTVKNTLTTALKRIREGISRHISTLFTFL